VTHEQHLSVTEVTDELICSEYRQAIKSVRLEHHRDRKDENHEESNTDRRGVRFYIDRRRGRFADTRLGQFADLCE